MRIGLTVAFGINEEVWQGRIADIWTLRNAKTFYYIKNAVSDSGMVQSFNIEDSEVIKIITDLEIEYGMDFTNRQLLNHNDDKITKNVIFIPAFSGHSAALSTGL